MSVVSLSGTRFFGDGRQTLTADPEVFASEPALANTFPSTIQRARASALIDAYLKHGFSNHSGRGSTLWVLVEFCKAKDLPYNINGTPAEGYYIESLVPRRQND